MCDYEYELPARMDPEEMMKGFDPKDPVYLYLNEIVKEIKSGSYKILSPDETEEGLARQLPSADEEIRDKLIVSNLTTVISIAKQYTGRGMDILDLIQEGNHGLLHAVNTFDPKQEISFSLYVERCVRELIEKELKYVHTEFRPNPELIENINKAVRCRRKLTDTLGREPTVEEMVEASDLPSEFLITFLHKDTQEEEIDILSEDILAVDPDPKDLVQEILDSMNPREAAVIRMRFGLDDGTPHTLEETAQAFGVTRERIRQIENKILRRRIHLKRRKRIRDFYN